MKSDREGPDRYEHCARDRRRGVLRRRSPSYRSSCLIRPRQTENSLERVPIKWNHLSEDAAQNQTVGAGRNRKSRATFLRTCSMTATSRSRGSTRVRALRYEAAIVVLTHIRSKSALRSGLKQDRTGFKRAGLRAKTWRHHACDVCMRCGGMARPSTRRSSPLDADVAPVQRARACR
jgi:hypothetical protein